MDTTARTSPTPEDAAAQFAAIIGSSEDGIIQQDTGGRHPEVECGRIPALPGSDWAGEKFCKIDQMSTGFRAGIASSRKTKAVRRKELEAEFGAAAAAHVAALHRQRIAAEQGLETAVCDAAVADSSGTAATS